MIHLQVCVAWMSEVWLTWQNWQTQQGTRMKQREIFSKKLTPKNLDPKRNLVPKQSIKNWMGPYQRTPKKVTRAIQYPGLGVRSVGPVGDFLETRNTIWFPKERMRRLCAPFDPPLRWLRTCLKAVWWFGKFLVKTVEDGTSRPNWT